MADRRLSDEVVAARMVEWRNLKKLHAHDRQQILELKQRVRTLEQEKADDRRYFEALIHQQGIQIAELQTMVFGRKKRPPLGRQDDVDTSSTSKSRSKDSYRRPIPPDAAVTATIHIPVDHCACGGKLQRITVHIRYVEDIPLPELTPGYTPHLVTKYVVQRGVCPNCGKPTSGRDLGGSAVTLGTNVRLLVCHLLSAGGMSYAQVTGLLLGLYGLDVSKAELVGILRSQHQAWLPAYEQLKADIRAGPVVHADETPWPIQDLQGQGYAWNLSDAYSPKVCFVLENNRGAVHAQELFGQDTDRPFAGVRVSDDYSPYRNPELPGSQQLCWAHLYRVIRDLRYNANLPEEQLPHVRAWYETFAAIYQDLRMYLDEPYDEVVRATQANELWQRTQRLASQSIPLTGEPERLTRLKAQLFRASQDKLFICLPKDTPCDNNRAERDLRQLVLKRKRSFGSRSERGAKALATVLSLCTTAWRTTPQGYFQALARLG